MVIRRVKLINFRCHPSFELICNKQTTVITGRNGCGKTSILEAIYEGLQGKSFRSVDREILRRGDEFYKIEIEYEDGYKVAVVFNQDKKEFLIEDKKTRRIPKKYKYPIVLFEPDDLHLVSSSPTSKRNYFDRIFSQLSDQYSVALSRYNKALKQRNELLKTEEIQLNNLFSWDVLLSKYGTEIKKLREEMISQINENFTKVYRSIAENQDQIKINYQSNITTEEEYINTLNQDFQRDLLLGYTSFGVHKDIFDFVFNNSKANGSASRGEVRSSVLALKFIEADLIMEKIHKKPVILLDDVFSELDKTRQNCLVKNFQNNQVILTSVGDGDLEID